METDPNARLAFLRQLGGSWREVAIFLQIPPWEQSRWRQGDESGHIWEWLQARDRLHDLPDALTAVDRADLAGVLDPPGRNSRWPDRVPQRDNQPDPRNVFVIHGRDEEARKAIFGLLRAVGLRPLEWEQAVGHTNSAAPFLGDVVATAFRKIRAAVAILTPDDAAFLHPAMRGADEPDYETRLTGQVRPNVLFELGMAIALHEDRTVIIEMGRLRPFADLGGRNVIRFDGSVASIKKIVDRLRTAGCDINVTGTDWLDVVPFKGLDAYSRSLESHPPVADATEASRRDRALALARSAADAGSAAEALRSIRAIPDDADRRTTLLEIARYLDDEGLTEAFSLAKILADRGTPMILAELMRFAAEEDNPRHQDLRTTAVSAAFEIIDPVIRAKVLSAMADYLDDHLVLQVLQRAFRIDNPFSLAHLIASFAPYLTHERMEITLRLTRRLDNDLALKEALSSFGPYLCADHRADALALAELIEDPQLRRITERALQR
ncbi:hypothetical protein Val02_05390 [Virgisporangium aliadipatigenens]|uniref:CD-NTase-associated protein 12/Pycsar effector protein TIR domain-containing protein n=1 Tax=Virgisporangium aliadipatigenens TaxID=741659 RepID=A0A8J3YG78_9ACTN|nr:nucleotide-binding protein [Virgisporangium aliadipatigenens]GIJ43653.1 hypothetical protein Val02_05390 [Virgisporangium aliadipatigenens]